jgi:hypothetical protein
VYTYPCITIGRHDNVSRIMSDYCAATGRDASIAAAFIEQAVRDLRGFGPDTLLDLYLYRAANVHLYNLTWETRSHGNATQRNVGLQPVNSIAQAITFLKRQRPS